MTVRSNPVSRRSALLLATAIGITVAWPPSMAATATSVVSEQLTITGAVARALTFKVDDLKAFPADQISTLTLSRKVDDKETPSTVRGVRLTSLLELATLTEADHNTWKHAFVVARATDGYQVVFSWPELFNTDVGPGVLVIFERDGAPLGDREGRLALVSGKDTRAGPRNVHWLTRIDVRIVKD